jgi:hypothetical protein
MNLSQTTVSRSQLFSSALAEEILMHGCVVNAPEKIILLHS